MNRYLGDSVKLSSRMVYGMWSASGNAVTMISLALFEVMLLTMYDITADDRTPIMTCIR